MVRRSAIGCWLGGLVSVAASVAFSGGCGDKPPASGSASGSSQPTSSAGGLDDQQLADLREIPYADFASSEDSAGGDGLVFSDPARVSPGLTLYSIQWFSAAELIDERGQVVHRWQHPRKGRWDNVELLPNGDLLIAGAEMSGQDSPDIRYYVSRMNWAGELLWQHYYNGHHDIEQTPAGRLLTLTFERRLMPEVHATAPLRDDSLTLLNQDGTLLEVFSIYEALKRRPDIFPIHPGRANVYAGKPWVNLLHANSVEWMHRPELVERSPIFALDNVLVCFRHQNRVAVINWEKREVVWAWGEKELDGPHDAQVLAGGNLLIFDNGLKRGWSRVIELDPVAGKIVWQYRAPKPKDFYTPTKGSNQRLPNGNTLIANSDSGQIFEVTSEGEMVWDFRCPHRNEKGERATIVRAKRMDPALIEPLNAQDEDAGTP